MPVEDIATKTLPTTARTKQVKVTPVVLSPDKVQPKPGPVAAEGLMVGQNVRYYSNGWRTGRFDGIEKKMLLIMPIGGHKHIKVSDSNVEPIEDIRGS